MNYTVHHACLKSGGKEFVEENAPFPSIYSEIKKPFLGSGHYFWEFNKEYAKVWGKNHCKNNFFIVECVIEIDHKTDGHYLDLAGNREHMINFVELIKEFDLIKENVTNGIDLAYIIEYLRDIAKEDEDIFPFKVIRAVDYKNSELKGFKIKFNETLKSYTMLNPRILISFYNKEDICYLKKPFVIFASN